MEESDAEEEEEDTDEDDEMYPREFDEDEKFLNGMFEGPVCVCIIYSSFFLND